MATATITATDEMSVTNLPANYGSGTDNHHPVGYWKDQGWRSRVFIKCGNLGVPLPAGAKIVSAVLRVKTTNATYHSAKGSNVRLKISRLLQSFDSSIGDGEQWQSSGGTTGFSLSSTTAITYPAEGQHKNSTVYDYDITDFVEDWLPSTYFKRNGTPCDAATNNGLEIKTYDENSSTRSTEFLTTKGGYAPRIVITYTTEADPPAATNLSPSGTLTSKPSQLSAYLGGTTAKVRWKLSTSSGTGPWNVLETAYLSTATGTQTYSLAAVSIPVGQTIYYKVDVENSIGAAVGSDVKTFYIQPVPTASIVSPTNGGLCHIWNLADLAVWADAPTAQAKPQVKVGHSHSTGVASTDVQIRINGTDVHAFVSAIASGSSKTFDIPWAVARNTNFTVEARTKAGGVWSDWTSAVTAKVNWGQAILQFSHAAGASGFTTQHASLAGGSATQVAYAYKAASEGVWKSKVTEVDPDTIMDVLVRLSTSDAGQVPSLGSVGVQWSEDPPPVPDFWEAVNADIELDKTTRRFGVHSLKVTPNPTTTYAIRVRNTETLVVSPDTVYTMSVYINTLGQSLSSGSFYLAYENEAGSFISVSDQYDNIDTYSTVDSTGKGAEDWQRIYATFKTGSDETRIKPMLVAPNDTPFQFRIDSFQLESGAIASSWRPGATGPAVILDVGGIAIDGEVGGIFRARSSGGEVVTLGAHGLELDGAPYLTAADIPGIGVGGSGVYIRTFTSNATYVPPAGLLGIIVEVQAGGGGGGGAQNTPASTDASGGGGGGAGGYCKRALGAHYMGSSYAIVVGGGGGGGYSTGGGASGGDSSVTGTNLTMTAAGGTGGSGGSSGGGQAVSNGGTGGGASGGSYSIAGQDGGIGGRMSFSGVSAARPLMSCHGGSSGLGRGGMCQYTNANGNGGGGYGSGGGGANNNGSQSARTGGSGRQGLVLITEIYLPVHE